MTDDMYIHERTGSDESGDGSEGKPLKTLLEAMRRSAEEPFPTFYTIGDDNQWVVVSVSQIKKIKKIWIREKRKTEDKYQKDGEDEERRLKNIEDSKRVVIERDDTLPTAIAIKVRDCVSHRSSRVTLKGWCHRVRRQGKAL
ncbi:unnamed protein product, partial [Oppiella nova]